LAERLGSANAAAAQAARTNPDLIQAENIELLSPILKLIAYIKMFAGRRLVVSNLDKRKLVAYCPRKSQCCQSFRTLTHKQRRARAAARLLVGQLLAYARGAVLASRALI
jgi:hypothetical protein